MDNSKWLIPAVIIVVLLLLAGKAEAVPKPPEGYVCPYCQIPFDVFEDLVAHVQAVHPGQRIPLKIDWA